ncbi:MAG: bifunctional phosphoribosylaminoimidazolecarboxamide formyltransferase/IMP cyclohydrolase [Acidimicrobiia bacterium]
MSRALVSVYDKTGLVPFVRRLRAAGYEVVSSGGTATTLREAGLEVADVADVTGAPEMLGGRVKTLHPKIHGGILARDESDDAELASHGIERFDLVVCNLYPFRQTLEDPEAGELELIEKIDIGGPAMIRAAAKNYRHVGVVVSPDQYEQVAIAVESGGLTEEGRQRLAAEAFFHTAAYDAAIVGWLGDDRVLPLRRVGGLRYGENPHQDAELFREDGCEAWWSAATQHQGKEMSFNNYLDTESAWRLAHDLGPNSVTVIKHTNAAGAARAASISEAFELAWSGDSLAAFGGVVAVHGLLDQATAERIAEMFVEVVVATQIEQGALDVLAPKTNVRVFSAPLPGRSDFDYRRVEGGFLAQTRDTIGDGEWEVASSRKPTDDEMSGLRFAWTVAAHAKSNAIVLARGEHVVAVGAGDQSRVGAASRAIDKAGRRSVGAVAASDAFFPFRDGVDTLAASGVTAIVEPGGSRNDQEVIDAADEHDVVLVFTGERHFRH